MIAGVKEGKPVRVDMLEDSIDVVLETVREPPPFLVFSNN